MNKFLIEKGVEMPPKATPKIGRSKYPWAVMEVGDSFFSPLNGDPNRLVGMRLYSSAFKWAALDGNGKKFKTRFVTEKCGEGIRVWRVA